MEIISKVKEMREWSDKARAEGKSIGFVPTMGYLHEGHLSLIRAAKKECETVVASIFVNPTQFGPGEDLDKYPRDIERDKELAEKEGVDALFIPDTEEMYPGGCETYVDVEASLAEGLCGRSRPGHFRGVATVVAKFFDIVVPDKSYFGQKDAQQAAVVKRMVSDLNIPVEIRVEPIVRESDGLAMSSRNKYLTAVEREEAAGLFRSLEAAKEMVEAGEKRAEAVRKKVSGILQSGEVIKVDYIETVDADSMAPVEEIKDNTLIAVAAYVGGTRLIDNIVIEKVKRDA